MGKHTTHRVPTCKRCGTQHYNMRPCPEVEPERPGIFEIRHRADSGVKSLDMSRGNVMATGAFVPGTRVDKHPARRVAATVGESA